MPELEEALRQAKGESYRAKQILRWLYRTPVQAIEEMKDLPADLRRSLDEKFRVSGLETADMRRSVMDGTTKYLFMLEDGNMIETVLLLEKARNTVCLSSQVGCKYSCAFCASAALGFIRNLTQSEILDQVISIRCANPSMNITNLVFMGIGEPFDNYDNVMRAIRIFNDKNAFNIGARKITVSTCGVVPGIEKLKKERLQIELSVSLHSADDGIRSKLLPVNSRYPLSMLMKACRDYIKETNRIVTFEYVLIKGVNSSKDDAMKLSTLLKGMKCKVNAISYNKIPGSPYEEPSEKEVGLFMKVLEAHKVNAMHRKPKGDDIDAGCGQLRISRMKK